MINVTTIISVIFAIFYIVILSVIARIDQKQIKIEKRTTMAGIGLAILYIISNYIIKPESIKYGIIYLGIYIILIAVDTFITKRYAYNRNINAILYNASILWNRIIYIYFNFNNFRNIDNSFNCNNKTKDKWK